MYHEVLPVGEKAVGDSTYSVAASRFVEQLHAFHEAGFRPVSLDAALDEQAPGLRFVLTFDDGTADHSAIVLPILLARGIRATFFVTTSWVGMPGYLTPSGVAQLARSGMSVQSHTHTHRFLDDLGEDDLREELRRSRDLIAEWTGTPPVHLSCPGGRTTPSLASIAAELGYVSISNSVHGRNAGSIDPMAIERLAIRRWTTSREALAMLTGGKRDVARRMRWRSLHLAKKLLGNRTYVLLRSVAFRALGRVS